MKDEMTFLVLILFFLHQLNKYAVGVQIIESNDSDVSMINNAVYKVLQACSKNDVNRVSIIRSSNTITAFIPYKWNLSNSVVIYNYNDENLFGDMETYPFNFQVIILYDFQYKKSFANMKRFNKLKMHLPWDRFVKLIAVTFDNISCTSHDTAYTIATQTLSDYIVHICKNKISQRVVVWTINSFKHRNRLHWFEGTDETTPFMGFSMRSMNEHIDTCDSVFYFHENLTRRNGRYTAKSYITSAIVKPYPPLMLLHNDSFVRDLAVDKFEKTAFTVSQRDWKIFGGYDGKVFATIFPLLRVKMHVHIYPEINEDNSSLINWSEMRKYTRMTYLITLNSYDWMFISLTAVSFTYPRVQREIRVITQSRGIVSMPVRIREIFNYKILVSAIIISGLFMLAQRYLDGRSFGNAALDAYCLILGLGIPKLPNTVASRIFFGSLIFYFIILCTHFQGNVTQIMTVPLVAANVDSLEDLEASGYTVYAGRSTYEDFEWFRKRFKNFVEHSGDHCIELVLSDPSAACIDEAEYLQHEILKHNNLHLVREPIKTFFATYLMNGHWDFKDRFEMMFATLSESGILHKWQKDIENLSKIRAQIWELRENHYDAGMTLENWKIFFILLYAGLFISTFVWIAEILYARQNLVQSLANVCIYFLSRIYFLFRQCLTVFYI